MIEPPPARRRAGMPYLQPRNTPFEVDVHRQVPDVFFGRDGVVVLGMQDAGVVEQHVELAEALLGGADHRLGFRGLRDVGVHVDRLAAGFADLPGDRLAGLVVDVDDDDPALLRGRTAGPTRGRFRSRRR